MLKCRRLRWKGHIVLVIRGDTRDAFKFLKYEYILVRMALMEKSGLRWEDNIKVALKTRFELM